MLGLLKYETPLFYVQQAAIAGLLIRFLVSGLYRTYRFFFVYLVVLAAQSLFPLVITRGTNEYGYVFLATEGAVTLLYALIVLELYSLVLRDLPGIASIARRYIKIALAIAICLSLLLLQFEQVPQSMLARFFTFESTIVCSLVLFVLLITVFLVYYPTPLTRNVIFYSIGYAFYFSSKAITLFLRNTGHQWDMVFSFVLLAVSTACLIFWIFSLSSAGEQAKIVIGHRWNDAEVTRVKRQLENMNDLLLKARK